MYRKMGHEPWKRAIAGVAKESSGVKRASTIDGVQLLGSVPRPQLLALMQNAALNVNLSTSEGMPRTSLEALALGTRVLLPLGIPEFERYCGSWVASSQDPGAIAAQFIDMLVEPPATGYPIETHSINRVLEKYNELFERVLKCQLHRS